MSNTTAKDNKLPISAIIVGLNEAHYLKNLFPKLSFCDEILYFDLGSIDNSQEIAKKYNVKFIKHEKVDSCEWIHAKFAKSTKHEWILITDPDELLSDQLIQEIFELFVSNKISETTAAISAPWQFYFKSRKLLGTNWGGISKRILLANNKRFQFSPIIHLGRNALPGFTIDDIAYHNENYIHHYWMTSYAKLLEKHMRYLKHEGEARYKMGKRATLKNIMCSPYRSFRYSFFTKQGYKDGVNGFILSLFWAWYESYAQWENYKYQQFAIVKNKK